MQHEEEQNGDEYCEHQTRYRQNMVGGTHVGGRNLLVRFEPNLSRGVALFRSSLRGLQIQILVDASKRARAGREDGNVSALWEGDPNTILNALRCVIFLKPLAQLPGIVSDDVVLAGIVVCIAMEDINPNIPLGDPDAPSSKTRRDV